MRIGIVGLGAALLFLSAGCTVTATAPKVVVHGPEVPVAEVVVSRPPPAVRVEEIPPPPQGHPELYVWHTGHWRWEHNEYVWHPGHYEKRPAASAVWVQPEWVVRGNQWVFKPGHWVYH
jgi:WXXGXW repeat (2 copies)